MPSVHWPPTLSFIPRASIQYKSTGRIRYNPDAIVLQHIWNPENDGAFLPSFKTKTQLQNLGRVQNFVITKRQELITQYYFIKSQKPDGKIIDGVRSNSGLWRLWPVWVPYGDRRSWLRYFFWKTTGEFSETCHNHFHFITSYVTILSFHFVLHNLSVT